MIRLNLDIGLEPEGKIVKIKEKPKKVDDWLWNVI